jgi:hypothetical protein
MNAVEDYAKRWDKRENEELDTLSEWVKSVRGILKSRSKNIRTKVRTTYPSVLKMYVPIANNFFSVLKKHN